MDSQPLSPQLELLGHRGRPHGIGIHYLVQGQVRNISDLTLEWVQAVVTLYDKEDKFLSWGSRYLEFTTLRPGEVSPFTVPWINPTSHPRGTTSSSHTTEVSCWHRTARNSVMR